MPIAGVHVYVNVPTPPLAVGLPPSTTDWPRHTAVSFPGLTTTEGSTKTDSLEVTEHPLLSVMVTPYTAFPVGHAIGLELEGLERAPDHE